jgi:hypothetical protein
MSNRVIYNVEYNIPRVNLSLPGRQNRTNETELRFTPGMTETVEFVFGNQDGVAINLLPFELKWVFWRMNTMDIDTLDMAQSEIILAKPIAVPDPYSGKVIGILESEETLKLGQEGIRQVRWSIFMINKEGQVFPAQVSSKGNRYATALLDINSGIPIAEIIKSA